MTVLLFTFLPSFVPGTTRVSVLPSTQLENLGVVFVHHVGEHVLGVPSSCFE